MSVIYTMILWYCYFWIHGLLSPELIILFAEKNDYIGSLIRYFVFTFYRRQLLWRR